MMYSIGHSTHDWERFYELLKAYRIEAIADVRSAPYSRHFPHFSKDELRSRLRSEGVAYVFLGKELGGRPSKPGLFDGAVADYEKMARESEFKSGLERLIDGSHRYRIAMMCAEHDPLDCHRCLLVSRALREKGIETNHILSNGDIISQPEIEEKLLDKTGRQSDDLFMARDEQLSLAYKNRAKRVAFSLDEPSPKMQEAS